MAEAQDGFLSGMKQFKFMRAFYGLAVCSAIGVVVTLLTRPEPEERQRGLVWGTIADALRTFKGTTGSEGPSHDVLAAPAPGDGPDATSEAGWPLVRVSRPLAIALGAAAGDILHISDRRRWLGGLRSSHAMVAEIFDADDARVELGPKVFAEVAGPGREEELVRAERLY
jgi:SSS family solute:Na+ symporter